MRLQWTPWQIELNWFYKKKKRSTEVLLFCKFARVTNFVHRSPMDTNRENINWAPTPTICSPTQKHGSGVWDESLRWDVTLGKQEVYPPELLILHVARAQIVPNLGEFLHAERTDAAQHFTNFSQIAEGLSGETRSGETTTPTLALDSTSTACRSCQLVSSPAVASA